MRFARSRKAESEGNVSSVPTCASRLALPRPGLPTGCLHRPCVIIEWTRTEITEDVLTSAKWFVTITTTIQSIIVLDDARRRQTEVAGL
jgi:hypothetical protein